MRPSTSEIVIACKGRSRYFDLDAIRTEHAAGLEDAARLNRGGYTIREGAGGERNSPSNPAGAPPLDHWWHNDHTGPYNPPPEREPTWPPDLCIKPILAMCPQRVCTTCGKPSERIVEQMNETYAAIAAEAKRGGIRPTGDRGGVGYLKGSTNKAQSLIQNGVVKPDHQTVGWSDCHHNTWRNGVVLDPFASNDTVLTVATSQGRNAIGITPTSRPEWNGMSNATWHIGDSLTVLRTLPSESVDLILTSPPFLALRSYLPVDHPDKNLEMGSEGTPGAFLDALLDVVVECRRVLAPHGSLCVELGDTYAGSGGAGGDYTDGNMRELQPRFAGSGSKHRMESAKPGTNSRMAAGAGWPLDKSLTLIPETFRFALAYGRNPHTGRTIEPWRVRNVVRWCRPNPPVGALGDKVRPATSDIAIACVSRSRYFDLDAVRTEYKPGQSGAATTFAVRRSDVGPRGSLTGRRSEGTSGTDYTEGPGAPPLDHWWHDEDLFGQDAWHIPTHPYPGAHYATWPPALCIKPVLAMCPVKVCTTCGKPSERITAATEEYAEHLGESWADRGDARTKANGRERNSHSAQPAGKPITSARRDTVGWSDCGHNTWRNGHVLDPFAGSGTTGVVATGHGRQFTGIDLDPRNHDLARERIGMWLQEAPPGVATVPTKGLL